MAQITRARNKRTDQHQPEWDDLAVFKRVLPLQHASFEEIKTTVRGWNLPVKAAYRALVIHCLFLLFERSEHSLLRKSQLYDDLKLFFEHHYSSTMGGAPEIGKLVKLVFNCPTRRIGYKHGAQYCYDGLRMKQIYADWISMKKPKKTGSYITQTMRFKIIVHPKINVLDDMFEKFLYDEKFEYLNEQIDDERLRSVSSMLSKSDILFGSFENEVDKSGILHAMIMDWYELNIVNLVRRSGVFKDRTLTLISTFPMVLDGTFKASEVVERDSLLRYFKIRYDHCKVNQQKIKMVHFLLELFTQFDNFAIRTFILHFKYVATIVLRNLSVQGKESFASYWMLYCFLDEFQQFLLEFYCYKKTDPVISE